MQKQNILKYASVKCAHPSQNTKNPALFENSMVFSKTIQQTAKKSEQGVSNYWKSTRVHTQGSETSDKKNTFKTFLDKDRSFKPTTQFKSKQNQRKVFDVSTGKIQKGHSEKVFKFVGNFVNINKNDSLRKQKMPDFFPISSKEKRSSANNFYNNFMGNVEFKVEPSKYKEENLVKVGSPNIHFKQQQSGNFLLNSPPQKTYLRRTVKTETDEVHTDQTKPEKPQPKYFRQSFNNLAVRKFQNDDHSFNEKQEKSSMGAKMTDKNYRNTQKAELNGNNYQKQNKQNRKTIFQSDEQTFDKFTFHQIKLTAQKDQQPKGKSSQNVFTFLSKNNKLEVAQKLNETVSIFRKQRPVPQNDRKQARVNTEENQKSPKPYFFKQKTPQSVNISSNQRSSAPQQSKAINWQRDLILEQKVGEGTFGKVFKAALRTDRSKQYALKRVMIDKKYKSREVEIVSQLSHPQVMKVYGTFVTVKQNNEYLNIVMDFYDQNLYEVINSHDQQEISKQGKNVFGTQKKFFQMRQKLFIYQLLKSLSYIHSLSICHRDIKPHNMLVRSWELVLCDFGSAKKLVPGEPNLSYICSRCYRAPQLIFGSTAYTTQIDIWSVACVILQMLNDSVPVFIGENSLEHLLEVIKIVGTPSKEQVLQMNQDYDVSTFDLPIIKRKQLSKLFPKADLKLIDLVEKILVYDPEKRLTAIEALGHVYFDDIRNKEIFNQLSNVLPKQTLQTFFVFDSKQLELFRCENAKFTKSGLRVLNEKVIESIRKTLIPDWVNFE